MNTGRIDHSHLKGHTMNFKHLTAAVVLSTALIGASAMAQTAAPAAPAKAPVAAAKAPAAKAAAKKAPSAAQLAQREKMKACNKQATGKKGADRQTFMKTCLSK